MATVHHFGQILKVFGIFRVDLVFGKIWNLLCQFSLLLMANKCWKESSHSAFGKQKIFIKTKDNGGRTNNWNTIFCGRETKRLLLRRAHKKLIFLRTTTTTIGVHIKLGCGDISTVKITCVCPPIIIVPYIVPLTRTPLTVSPYYSSTHCTNARYP